MNDHTNDDAAAVRRGMELYERVKLERDDFQARLIAIERAYEKLIVENEQQRGRIEESEYQRNFYMRHSTELTVNLHNVDLIAQEAANRAGEYVSTALGIDKIVAIVHATVQRARDAAYKPQVTPPTRVRADDDGEPIPRFLTSKPNAMDELAKLIGVPQTDDGAQIPFPNEKRVTDDADQNETSPPPRSQA